MDDIEPRWDATAEQGLLGAAMMDPRALEASDLPGTYLRFNH